MKTEVCITVDTEFSIGGAFSDPEHNKPVGGQMVLCEVEGRSQGLGFLLDTLQEYGLRATFFAEALQTYYFGDRPMAELTNRIVDYGHDVQLHLHPCWRLFGDANWKRLAKTTLPNDSMAGLTVAELEELMSDGIMAFKRWNLPRPIALRTGGLHVDKNVYAAMARQDLRLSSNIGLAIFQPEESTLHLNGGVHRLEGVVEVPVLTYSDFQIGRRRHKKTLTVTGSSWTEIRTLLEAAARARLSPVVIMTHPFEYVKNGDHQLRGITPNRVNQARLVRLCAYLARHHHQYEVVTFQDAADRWHRRQDSTNLQLGVSPWATAGRIIENRLNDYFAWY